MEPRGRQLDTDAHERQDRPEITFSGIDWRSGDSLIIATPDLIIGYDKDDGKVIGFKPES